MIRKQLKKYFCILPILLIAIAFCFSESLAVCLQGDCYNGKGTYQFDDGGVYKGQWKNGRMNGIGRFSINDDWVEGIWENARLKKATAQKARKNYLPEKKVDDNPYRCIHGDCEEGYGVFQYEDGQYSGYWKNKKRHGSGDFYWNEGNHYSGEWREDKMSGHGFLEYKNGDRFSGIWLNGKRDGPGTLWKADSTVIKKVWKEEEPGSIQSRVEHLCSGLED